MNKLDILLAIMTIAALAGAYLVRRHDKRSEKDGSVDITHVKSDTHQKNEDL